MFYLFLFTLILAVFGGKEEHSFRLSNGPYTVGARRNNSDLLTVHVISHTHCDPGWIRTTDEYYVKQVRYILDTIIPTLEANPERKFTFVEQKFFQLWWAEQKESVKARLRKLVDNGQFELNLGGWIMVDEAAPEYEGMIMNMAVGAQFIKDQFGVRPKVAWHVDPFGHSQQNARLIADMGFDAFAINRIDYRTKADWLKKKELEFVWRTSTSLGNDTDIFVHTMSNHYCPPAEVDLGIWVQKTSSANSEWPNDASGNPEIESYPSNMKAYADRLADVFRSRQQYWNNGNHLLLPFGCDFTFTNAELNFLQMDNLMKYYNDHFDEYNIRVQYSHFSDYVKALHDTDKEWKLYTGDLMPYPDEVASWTGYYTSRPRFKGESRAGSNMLRTVDILDSLVASAKKTVDPENVKTKLRLRKIASEVLHHDAITGTEKQYVADDYLKRLSIASTFGGQLSSKLVLHFTENSYTFSMNSTSVLAQLKSGTEVGVVMYNNIAWDRDEVVTLVSPISNVEVYDSNGQKIKSQTTPIPSFSLDITNGSYYLYFNTKVPALGHTTVTLRYSNNVKVTPKSHLNGLLENSLYSLDIDQQNGHILTYIDKKTSIITKLESTLYHYTGAKNSGAYVFRPDGEAVIVTNNIMNCDIYHGDIVDEAYIQYRNGYVCFVRVFKVGDKMKTFEINFHLGPLDEGKELVTRFSTDITNTAIYTDANGLETMKRENKDTQYPISGNYFPQTTRTYIENTDGSKRLTFITDRAHGVASLKSGQLEIMLHRRCRFDDGYGVEEPLTENDRVKIQMWGYIDTKVQSIDYMRRLSILLNHQPHQFFVSTPKYEGTMTSTSLVRAFPPNIHIVDYYIPTDRLVFHFRLHHIYELSDANQYAVPVTMNLNDIFKGFKIKSVKELTLMGNELLSKVQSERYVWKIAGGQKTGVKRSTLSGMTVTLHPMDIGTYEIEYE